MLLEVGETLSPTPLSTLNVFVLTSEYKAVKPTVAGGNPPVSPHFQSLTASEIFAYFRAWYPLYRGTRVFARPPHICLSSAPSYTAVNPALTRQKTTTWLFILNSPPATARGRFFCVRAPCSRKFFVFPPGRILFNFFSFWQIYSIFSRTFVLYTQYIVC